MSRSVLLLPEAEQDLLRLEDFLIERAPRAALRASALISDAVLSLSELPERGRSATTLGLRELVVPFGGAAYIIHYRVREGSVVVSRIFHSREDR